MENHHNPIMLFTVFFYVCYRKKYQDTDLTE